MEYSIEILSRMLLYNSIRENILIKDDILKLADLGSCKGIYSKPPFTEYISTRWYRAPECLLTDGYYNYKVNMVINKIQFRWTYGA
jgi:serine/threonine protein kinase